MESTGFGQVHDDDLQFYPGNHLVLLTIFFRFLDTITVCSENGGKLSNEFLIATGTRLLNGLDQLMLVRLFGLGITSFQLLVEFKQFTMALI